MDMIKFISKDVEIGAPMEIVRSDEDIQYINTIKRKMYISGSSILVLKLSKDPESDLLSQMRDVMRVVHKRDDPIFDFGAPEWTVSYGETPIEWIFVHNEGIKQLFKWEFCNVYRKTQLKNWPVRCGIIEMNLKDPDRSSYKFTLDTSGGGICKFDDTLMVHLIGPSKG